MRSYIKFLLLTCIGIMAFSLLFTDQGFATVDPKTAYVIWTFEEGDGDKVKDQSGNGNDGVIKGPSVKWVKGKNGSGLLLGGSNNMITSVTATGVSKTFFSECLWVNFENFSAEAQFGYIKSKGGASTRFFYFSSWSSAGGDNNCIHAGVLDLAGAWGRGISTGRLFEKGKWYFVCAVIDTKKGSIKVYVDGKLAPGGEVAMAAGDVPTEPIEIWVGGSPENYQWVNGTIDDVAFFNVALTEDDINTIMQNGLGKGMAVDPSGKLSAAWGQIRRGY